MSAGDHSPATFHSTPLSTMQYTTFSILLWSCIPLLVTSQPTLYASKLSAATCEPPPDGKTRDHDGSQVKYAARWFCDHLVSAEADTVPRGMTRGMSMHGGEVYNGDKPKDNVYSLTIDSFGECAKEGYELKEPVQGIKCPDVFYDMWKECEYDSS